MPRSTRLAGTAAAATACSVALTMAVTTLADAAAPIKVTQSASDAGTLGNSVTCNGGGIPAEQGFFRRFDLATDWGISQGFAISTVTFAVEASTGAVAGSVKVWAIDASDAFTLANLEPVSTVPVADLGAVANGALQPVTVSATVPAGKQMVLEIHVDAGATQSWFPGSNTAAETKPSYIQAPGCGIAQPTTLATAGFPNMHLVLFANGTAIDCTNAEAAVPVAEAALATAQGAVAPAQAAADKAAKKAKKAAKKAKKAKKAYTEAVADFGADSPQADAAKAKKAKAAKKARKAKKASKAAAAALAAAQAAVTAAQASLTAKQAAVGTECAQPALPTRPGPADGSRPAPVTSGSGSLSLSGSGG